jgi:hypothetical protein
MKFIQIATIQNNENHPPQIIALSEEGEIYIYSPEITITHGNHTYLIENPGWKKLPNPETT